MYDLLCLGSEPSTFPCFIFVAAYASACPHPLWDAFFQELVENCRRQVRKPWVQSRLSRMTVSRALRAIAHLTVLRCHLFGFFRIVLNLLLDMIIVPYISGALLVRL